MLWAVYVSGWSVPVIVLGGAVLVFLVVAAVREVADAKAQRAAASTTSNFTRLLVALMFLCALTAGLTVGLGATTGIPILFMALGLGAGGAAILHSRKAIA